jgi:RNA polymerase sigma factor (sigma-70 family)
VLRDAHAAEDVFQAAFLVLARKAATIQKQESLAAWLHRVALNIARTARAGASQRQARERQAVVMSRPDAVDEVAQRDWQLLVHEEVDRLPEKYRVPVVLCYLEGKTHEQAASQLRWPLGTVKGRLARARDLLRKRLVRRGLTVTGAGVAALLGESATAGATVSPSLLGQTLRGAVAFAVGGVEAGTVASQTALALARGALQATATTKLFPVVALALALALTTCALVAGTLPGGRRAESPPPPGQADGGPQRPTERPAPPRVAFDLNGDPLPPGAIARLGTIRFRVPAGTSSITFLPGDTTLLALGGGSVSTWDVSTGKQLKRYECPGGSGSYALTPDGKTLAVGTYTDDPNVVAIYLRDVATGRTLRECRGHAHAPGLDSRAQPLK